MKIKAKSDTLLKLRPAQSTELMAAEKWLAKIGSEFEIEYYIEAGSNHWQIELLNPVGDGSRTSWFIFKLDFELRSPITLKVTSDTLFKQAPKLSSELSAAQKIFVKNGTQFEVASYLPAANHHTKVALANAALGPEKRNTWYAYTPDIKLQGDRQELKVISDTLFKATPRPSSELSEAEKIFVQSGTVFELNSHGGLERSHIKVALQDAFLGASNRNTWYAYAPDVQISGNIPGNNPNDSNAASISLPRPSSPSAAPPAAKPSGSASVSNPAGHSGGQPANPRSLGKAMKFPGFAGVYYTNSPIILTTAYGDRGNFTWGEATHGGSRIPTSQEVVYGMIRVVKALEDIRHLYGGRPIQVTSWYRPPSVNAAVGGASRSRHLVGDAVDFVIAGHHPYDVFDRLDRWWGGQGGLASATVFTHIDTRGYRARWSYGY